MPQPPPPAAVTSEACTAWLSCAPPPAPCAPSAECVLFTSRTSFPAYGNNTYGDCEYAAAADWEIVALNREPAEAEVLDIYHEVASGALAGQGIVELWTLWPDRGIDGVRAHLNDTLYRPQQGEPSARNAPTPAAVRELARTHGVLMATLLDPESAAGHMHEVVIAGFTPAGPVIVTWGGIHQMTWTEWGQVIYTVETPEVISS